MAMAKRVIGAVMTVPKKWRAASVGRAARLFGEAGTAPPSSGVSVRRSPPGEHENHQAERQQDGAGDHLQFGGRDRGSWTIRARAPRQG